MVSLNVSPEFAIELLTSTVVTEAYLGLEDVLPASPLHQSAEEFSSLHVYLSMALTLFSLKPVTCWLIK